MGAKAYTAEQRAGFADLYVNGASFDDIKVETGASQNAVRTALRNAGIPVRESGRPGMTQYSVGDVFGELVIQELNAKWDGRGVKHQVLCRRCGTICLIRPSTLRTMLCCGCKPIGSEHPTWKGFGDIGLSFFTSVQRGAFHRGLAFSVTIEECWELFLLQEGKCALSGLALTLLAHRQPKPKQPDSDAGGLDGGGRKKRGKSMQTASLDRIDSTKGYTPDNVQWVHKTINRMKMDMTDSQFIEFCVAVARNKATL